jgi:tetratricopeptide (TPR) repeat protein
MSLRIKFNISWLGGILVATLLLVVISMIVWKLVDTVSTDASRNKSTIIATDSIELSDQLAKKLVEHFLATNHSQKDKNNIEQAINNTLQHLQDSNNSQVLFLLQSLELNTALGYLRTSISEEEPRKAAKIWIDIGNLQQLLSSEQALLAYQKAGKLDRYNSDSWNRLGYYYRGQKKFILAENAYKRVLGLPASSNRAQAVALANLGLLYEVQGKFVKAEIFYLEALQLNTLLKNLDRIASNNEHLAILSRKNNNFEEAKIYYVAALSGYEKLGRKNSVANVHFLLASLYFQNKYFEKAKLHYQLALDIYKRKSDQRKMASIYSALGALHQQQRNLEKSQILFEKSLALNQKIKKKKGVADQYGNLGVIYRLQKKFMESEVSHFKSLHLYQQLQYEDGLFQQQINLGFLYRSMSESKKACEHWLKGKEILVRANHSKRILRLESIIKQHCGGEN